MTEILIRNGEIVDGSGAPRRKADVLVRDGRIADIGLFPSASADTVIDAQGKVIAPGFIDLHSHEDLLLPVAPEQESLVRQGITTVITGNCGVSPAPLSPETRAEVIAMQGEDSLPWHEWGTFASYLDFIEKKGSATNVISLVGQGMVRSAIMGHSADRPTEEQMERMQKEVHLAMEAGAFGLSTGLIYPPGSYASTEELVQVTQPVGEHKGFYFSHIRGEGDTLLESLAEAIEIGRRTGASVEISHYKAAGRDNWWKAAPGLELIDKARAEGLDVTVDMYPYTAGGTSLVYLLPEWAHEGGKEAIMQRLQDASTRAKMTQDMKTTGFFRVAEWDKVLIPECTAKPEYSGRTIAELSDESGKDPYTWVFDTLLETGGDIGMILFMMDEDNVRMQLRHPVMMIGTDGVGLATEGPLAGGKPHPRNFGTFVKVLGQYVREEKILTLEEAVAKMTGMPARRLRLTDRGLIKTGFQADLVILDPNTVADRSTYTDPLHYPDGIEAVLVNGVPVIENTRSTGKLPGAIVRF